MVAAGRGERLAQVLRRIVRQPSPAEENFRAVPPQEIEEAGLLVMPGLQPGGAVVVWEENAVKSDEDTIGEGGKDGTEDVIDIASGAVAVR